MNYKVSRMLSASGEILQIFSFLFLVPLAFSFVYDKQWSSILGIPVPTGAIVFALCFAICFLAGQMRHFLPNKANEEDLNDREGFMVVGIGWLVVTLFSSFPFLISGIAPSFADAFFEAMSGLTSTGASILNVRLESLPRSVMLWRAMLNFIGGLGIIVLSAAILTRLTHGGSSMLQAESTGTGMQKLTPRLKETAKILWKIYLIFCGSLFVILLTIFLFSQKMAFGDAFYDAMIHTMTTMGTGGFSNHSNSIGFYNNPLVEATTIVFMLIGATSFTLHHAWMKGKFRQLLRDAEWRMMLAFYGAATLVITAILSFSGFSFTVALRQTIFTVVSLGSSTGFAIADYDAWPHAAYVIILLLMFTGGSAGSTAGGMKILRIVLLGKVVLREMQKLLHPKEIIPVKLAGKTIKEPVLLSIIGFMFTFLTIWLLGTITLLVLEPQLDLLESASGAASMMGNTGPALGALGPTDNYAFLTGTSKIVLSFLMWFGRLEVFTPLLIFTPGLWRR